VTKLSEDLESNLYIIADLKGPGVSAERLVLEEGGRCDTRPFSRHEHEVMLDLFRAARTRFPIKQCYRNSQLLLIASQCVPYSECFYYAEGFASYPGLGLPIEHAILTLNGKAVDVTWRDSAERDVWKPEKLLARVIKNQAENQYWMLEWAHADFVAGKRRNGMSLLDCLVRDRIITEREEKTGE
jgi:hypothetical protein